MTLNKNKNNNQGVFLELFVAAKNCKLQIKMDDSLFFWSFE